MGRKIIVRIDDLGYTDINNIGAFEVFDHGIGTAADVMLDTPGTEDALRRLKDYPWISVGWHTHFWGSPVLGPERVPSLMDPNGSGHFRTDMNQLTEGICYEELLAEMRAQIDRCVSILGKAPDTMEMMSSENSLATRAKRQVAEEYGIVTGFSHHVRRDPETGKMGWSPSAPQWAEKKIFWMEMEPAYRDLYTDSIREMGRYDPVKYYTEDRGHILELPEDGVFGQAWHPGFVDFYMCRCGDHGPWARNFLECRPLDMFALCSDEIKAWIRENKVELMSFTDALYGRRDYQNHLRNTRSDLCVL